MSIFEDEGRVKGIYGGVLVLPSVHSVARKESTDKENNVLVCFNVRHRFPELLQHTDTHASVSELLCNGHHYVAAVAVTTVSPNKPYYVEFIKSVELSFVSFTNSQGHLNYIDQPYLGNVPIFRTNGI